MKTTIPTQTEYEQNELRDLGRTLRRVETAPLAERKETRDELLGYMRTDPELIGERVGWLINGSYGYGACMRAKAILSSRANTNKRAQLVQLVGALEWRCPMRFTAQAWNELTPEQRSKVNEAVDYAIETTECAIA